MTVDSNHLPIVETGVWPDEAAAQRMAQAMARPDALAQAFIALEGDLGAGKTTWVRHLLRALGATGPIKSPTYALVEPYALPGLNVWHFDLYRFTDPQEWEDAGFRDIFSGPGLKLVEWPQRAQSCLPTPDLTLHVQLLDAQRRGLRLQAHTPCGLGLVRLARAALPAEPCP
ncbi:MAG: hypothetical protein OHK0048_12590 [Rhodoferax sp.]